MSTVPGIAPKIRDSVSAKYIGGHPDHPSAPVAGKLSVRDGALRFSGDGATEALSFVQVRIAIPLPDLRAIDLGPADKMASLVRGAAGFFVAGAIGGLVGLLSASKSSGLVIAAHHAGRDMGLVFGVSETDGRWLLAHVQRGRAEQGAEPVPTMRDLDRSRADQTARGQADTLTQIRDLLSEQNQLLRDQAELLRALLEGT